MRKTFERSIPKAAGTGGKLQWASSEWEGRKWRQPQCGRKERDETGIPGKKQEKISHGEIQQGLEVFEHQGKKRPEITMCNKIEEGGGGAAGERTTMAMAGVMGCGHRRGELSPLFLPRAQSQH